MTSATTTASAAPRASSSAARGEPIVDLLHTVQSVVILSSKVDNPRDFPEHLVDGKLDTAWNGRSGDLVGGWIDFVVPDATRVTGIALTPGYAHTSKSGDDYFTQNHRIARVRVSREDKPIGEFALDINKRELQTIAIDALGGHFRIEVLATVAGSKKEWRELVVSELRVYGERRGVPDYPSHMPEVVVHTQPKPRPPLLVDDGSTERAPAPTGPFATLEEMCAKYRFALKPPLDAAFGKGLRYPGPVEPECRLREADETALDGLKESALPHDQNVLAARFYSANTTKFWFTALALKTSRGWTRTDARVTERTIDDPGCQRMRSDIFRDAKIETMPDGSSVFVLQFAKHVVGWGSEEAAGESIDVLRAIVCRVKPDGSATCDAPLLLAERDSFVPNGFVPYDWSTIPFDPEKPPWRTRKTLRITSDAGVELTPFSH